MEEEIVEFRKILKYGDEKSAAISIPAKWFKELNFDEKYPVKLTKKDGIIIIESMAEIIKSEARMAGNVMEKAAKILEKTGESVKPKTTESTPKPEITPEKELKFEEVKHEKISIEIEEISDVDKKLGEFDWERKKEGEKSPVETPSTEVEETVNEDKIEFEEVTSESHSREAEPKIETKNDVLEEKNKVNTKEKIYTVAEFNKEKEENGPDST